MNININILKAGGNLKKIEDTIEGAARKAVVSVSKKIPVENVDIVFFDSKFQTIEHIGFGGYTVTKNLIMVPVDSKFDSIDKSIKENLGRTIAHELYHCLKDYTYENKFTLLESLVNEGLADHFETEISGGIPEKWDTALNQQQLISLGKRAKEEFNSYEFDHSAWFFGTKKDIPYWAGYSLGFDIVKKYLEKHPEKKASTSYEVPIQDFI
ncbi:MAG: hypothetical protein A2776_00250 [Candidatus Levybacteria bacterium RIFCSPHIGHO2_01_FULL_40_10]|nr:MAG: hypothetical protein A2776_00250 [Candidatus Levybacteria bacterium RIFCSPHIGHO2_01_FULL_40_10]